MANQHTSGWTPAQDALLSQLWDSGISAGIIEDRFKGVKSRCAVLGRLQRTGKLCGDRVTVEDKRFHADPKAKAAAKPSYRKPRKVRVLIATPASLLASFADLDAHACLWPMGNPMQEGFRHCGAHKQTGKPYCQDHAAKSRKGG